MLSPVRTEACARQHHLNQFGLSWQHGWRPVEASFAVDLGAMRVRPRVGRERASWRILLAAVR